MCGIAGTIGRVEKALREASLEKIAHRGPDGSGQWASDDGNIWLGHRRLAIIDPEGGKQPLSNEDGTVWVTFNGCVYNYLELAQSLRQKGHRFKTHSDTEVIIHAYEEWGEACVERFIGMFAFAIWDSRKQSLFCVRDRIGVKPFYYAAENGKFFFASEIKALLALGIKPEASTAAIEEYLIFQTKLGNRTLFKNVYSLEPGSYMVVDNKGSIKSKKRYWDLDFTIDQKNTEEYFIDHLKTLLNDAIKIRLRSDVTLGAHLSGGMDSSTVVCLANEIKDSSEPLVTFTGGFRDGRAFDETEYARLVAERAGAANHIIWPEADDFRDHIQKIIYYMDEPQAGPGVFPQYMVSKLASEHVKVVLGGQAGDEIFAGYARYLIGYLEEALKGCIEGTDETAAYVATLQTLIPNLSTLKQYIPMLKYFWADGLFEPQEKRYLRLMDRSAGIKNIYSPDIFSTGERLTEEFGSIFKGSNAASFLNKMLYFDMKVHLPALLHVEDRVSMAWGIESRVPLLDHRIVELMAKIPPVIKFRNGQPKYLFRKAVKNIIPEEILTRKDKMGFPVPLHLWLRGPLKDFTFDTLLSSKAKERGIFNAGALEASLNNEKEFGRVIWGALCLELWFKSFIDA